MWFWQCAKTMMPHRGVKLWKCSLNNPQLCIWCKKTTSQVHMCSLRNQSIKARVTEVIFSLKYKRKYWDHGRVILGSQFIEVQVNKVLLYVKDKKK